ncbi:MAG: hypothetical protein ACI9WU_004068 [Myxococcota bacterium]|jgi:hypothetical protein
MSTTTADGPVAGNGAIKPKSRKPESKIARWWGFDLRSIAAYRVALALIMLADLYNRSPFLRAHYTDFGILPRKVFVDGFMNQWLLSFHLITDKPWYVAALFCVQAFFAFWLLFGYRTKIATFIGWAFTISLQARQPMILQAGDVLYRIMLFWALFMPLGARWSIDAAMDQTKRYIPKRVFNVVTAAFMLQIFYAYWFVVFHRITRFGWPAPWIKAVFVFFGIADPEDPIMGFAREWSFGGHELNLTAVYFAASIDHFATPLAHWLLEYPGLLKVFTALTMFVEGGGVFLALLPWWPARLLAVLIFWGMHASFGLVLAVGMFVFISAATWIPFIPGEVWDFIEGRFKGKRLTVLYDPQATGVHKLLLATQMMLFHRQTTLVPFDADPEAGAALGGKSWGVRLPDGTVKTADEGVFALLAASPVFWFCAWPARGLYWVTLTPVAMGLALVLFILAVLVHGDWLWGLGWLLVFSFPRLLLTRLEFRPNPWRRSWWVQGVAGFFFVYISLWNADTVVGKKAKVTQRPLAQTCHFLMSPFDENLSMSQSHSRCKRLGWMLRIDQRWNMFSPYPMKGDGWFISAGTLRDGRTVDVWRHIYPDVPREWDGWSFKRPKLSSTFYPGQRWRKYLMNIWLKKYKKHRLHFGRWMCRAFNEGKKGGDRLQTFHLFYMKETTVLKSEKYPDGHKPHQCITLWRHWCTNAGKNGAKKPAYELECQTYKAAGKVKAKPAAATDNETASKPDAAADNATVAKPATPAARPPAVKPL